LYCCACRSVTRTRRELLSHSGQALIVLSVMIGYDATAVRKSKSDHTVEKGGYQPLFLRGLTSLLISLYRTLLIVILRGHHGIEPCRSVSHERVVLFDTGTRGYHNPAANRPHGRLAVPTCPG
jgi:hypothetical protein